MATGVTQAGGVTAIPGGASTIVLPPGISDSGIQAGIDAIALAGGGTVYLSAGTYTINTPIALKSGVSIEGVQSQYTSVDLIDGKYIPSGGTILLAGAATTGLAYHNTDLGSPPSPWATTALNNVRLENIVLSGFTTVGIQVGAQDNPGMNACTVRNVMAYSCGWGMIFQNFGGCVFDQLWAHKCSVGGIKMQMSTLQQQIGNSYVQGIHVDLTDLPGTTSNYAQGFVCGNDSRWPTANTNQMKVNNIEVFAFVGRTIITDTATFNGTTSISVVDGTKFPVGMPIQFTSAASVFTNNRTYFVKTQVGNVITVANSKTTAAIAAPGSGTSGIRQTGHCLVDLGPGTTNSFFNGIDVEGNTNTSIAHIYGDSLDGVSLQILETTAIVANTAKLCLRNCVNVVVYNQSGQTVPDIDPTSSANAFWLGKKATGQQGAPQGFFYDVTNLLPAFNLSNKYVAGAGTTPDIYSTNDATLHLSNPLAQPVFNFTTTIGMSAFQGGIVLLEPSSVSQVFTLPQITASDTLGSKSDGLPFTLINPGTQATPQTCTVVSNGTTGTGQSIYSSAAAGVAKSTITLVAGASCQIVACHNTANNTSFWYVIANNGATFT